MLLRADIAPPGLSESLVAAGSQVEEVTAYRTVRPTSLPEEAVEALKAGRVDWVTFTASSTVRNFLRLAGEQGVDASSLKLAAIGPVTAETLRDAGLEPTIVAQPHPIDALVEAIIAAER